MKWNKRRNVGAGLWHRGQPMSWDACVPYLSAGSSPGCLTQSQLSTHRLGSQQIMTPARVSLPSRWETQIEFLLPCFRVAQPMLVKRRHLIYGASLGSGPVAILYNKLCDLLEVRWPHGPTTSASSTPLTDGICCSLTSTKLCKICSPSTGCCFSCAWRGSL